MRVDRVGHSASVGEAPGTALTSTSRPRHIFCSIQKIVISPTKFTPVVINYIPYIVSLNIISFPSFLNSFNPPPNFSITTHRGIYISLNCFATTKESKSLCDPEHVMVRS